MAGIELEMKIRQAVASWRAEGYQGASDVTKRLLNFWFRQEHLSEDGTKFEFWLCQKEAIEALIYIWEVCKYRDLVELFRGFQIQGAIPVMETWAKYCFKMATGSGKTFVMALAMVWQYFNKLRAENEERYSSHFLLISPNIIVLDRLLEGFRDGKLFNEYPFIPPEWRADFDFQLIQQSEDIASHSKGILHLTNIQQLYGRSPQEPENPIQEILGQEPLGEPDVIYNTLLDRLTGYDDLLVLNDEAHHVHSEDLEWNKVIVNLDGGLQERHSQGLVMQLDFTATPKFLQTGDYFPHIIYNYPLAEAIKDMIVKRPKIGILENVPAPVSKDFVRKNRYQIDTGIQLHLEFKQEFSAVGKKPVLFIMTDNTTNADKVGAYLEEQPRYKDKVLVIHTDTKGVITKKDLNEAREAARNIDTNQYEAIVSVLMLREGWDVKNVCVIVPLRAFDSPILPEQTLGRGLRRMESRDLLWQEKLIVVDHPRFRALWEAEIEKGEIGVDIVSIRGVYEPSNLVAVDPNKLEYDFEIPIISGGLMKTAPDISKLDVRGLPGQQFIYDALIPPKVKYKEKDLLTQKIELQRELAFDYAENYQDYLAYITIAILSRSGSAVQFPLLVPIVRDYIENHLFDKEVDISEDEVLKKVNMIEVREKLRDVFCNALNALAKKVEDISIKRFYKLSQTPPFHTSEPVYPAKKTVFECLPYSGRSVYEQRFMRYLDERDDVEAFTKVLTRIPLHIHYYDREGFLRYYRPDFVVKTEEGFFLVETKGEGFDEMETVKLKAEAARRWCKAVTEITGSKWHYVKILQREFELYFDRPFLEMAEILSEKPPLRLE